MRLRISVGIGAFLGLGVATNAEILTNPSQLSPNFSLIDFENVTAANPLVVDGVIFTSLTGSLSIFDASHWPANGTVISSKTLFPGGEPDSAISIEFAEPVSEVLIGWGDPNFDGNVLQAFGLDGSLLEEAPVELGPIGGVHAAWIGFKRATPDIKRVVIQPDQSRFNGDDYVVDNVYFGASPRALLSMLIGKVVALNVRAGIANSLDAKLQAVMAALDDNRENNDVGAANALSAFVNAVQAQSGKQLEQADADALIALARRITVLIGG